MRTEIKSDTLTALINHHGAQVSSVKNRTGLEFIWQANKEVWPRHAPVLFPIVGKVKDNKHIFDGKPFELGQHGFARDRTFVLIHKSADSCTYQLDSNAESKNIYPFDFVFQVNYKLNGNILSTSYKIINPSFEPLFFSVGAHPGLICPLKHGENFEDYYIEFENASLSHTELNNGLRTDTKTLLQLDGNRLFLSDTLFDKDALVFENGQVEMVTLGSVKSSHKMTLTCKGWPYFGIWSKKGCRDFICLEPWYGVADKENSDHQLISKEGIIKLERTKEFNCSFSMRFF